MSVLSGVLGRSPLANFALARVQPVIVSAGPCPYIPASYINIASPAGYSSTGPILGNSIPPAPARSTDAFSSKTVASDVVVPRDQVGVGVSTRPSESFTAAPAYTPMSEVDNHYAAYAATTGSLVVNQGSSTADSASLEPLPVKPSLDQKPPPTAESIPVRKIECR